MSDQDTNDELAQPEKAPNVPLWVQAVFAVILSALVIGWAFSWGTDRIPEGIARAELDDGTVLVLRQVTTGTTHQMTVEVPDGPWTGTRDEVLDVSDGSHFWGLWLTRHDPDTGQAVEFDECSHCIAETGEHQVEDTDRRRALLEKGLKPLWTNGSGSGPLFDRNQTYVYQSRLPVLRKDADSFRLHVFHQDNGEIAVFDVPFPVNATSSANWTAGPIPQTASDDDLEVTLESISSRGTLPTHWFQPDFIAPLKERPDYFVRVIPDRLPQVTVQHEISMRYKGQPSDEWMVVDANLEDALGNKGTFNDCRLSPAEDAWKLNLRLFRKDDAEFESANQFTIANVPLPMPDQTHAIGDSFSFDGLTINVLSIGGTGNVTATFPSTGGGSSHSKVAHFGPPPGDWGAGGVGNPPRRIVGGELQVEQWEASVLTERTGINGTATVTTDVPFVIVQGEGMTPDYRLSLIVTDEAGERLSTETAQHNEMQYTFFNPPDGAQQVNLRVIVQRVRTVEFLVKPPISSIETTRERTELLQSLNGRGVPFDNGVSAF